MPRDARARRSWALGDSLRVSNGRGRNRFRTGIVTGPRQTPSVPSEKGPKKEERKRGVSPRTSTPLQRGATCRVSVFPRNVPFHSVPMIGLIIVNNVLRDKAVGLGSLGRAVFGDGPVSCQRGLLVGVVGHDHGGHPLPLPFTRPPDGGMRFVFVDKLIRSPFWWSTRTERRNGGTNWNRQRNGPKSHAYGCTQRDSR